MLHISCNCCFKCVMYIVQSFAKVMQWIIDSQLLNTKIIIIFFLRFQTWILILSTCLFARNCTVYMTHLKQQLHDWNNNFRHYQLLNNSEIWSGRPCYVNRVVVLLISQDRGFRSDSWLCLTNLRLTVIVLEFIQ